MGKTPPEKTDEKLTPVFHNKEKFYLKENGLPVGYGLFWKNEKGVDKPRYIYVKFNGRGISCRTTQWQKAVDFVREKRAEASRKEVANKPTNLTVQTLLDRYVAYLEKKNNSLGEYKPKTAQITKSTIKSRIGPAFGPVKADKLMNVPERFSAYREKRGQELMAKTGKPEIEVQYTIDHELSIVRSAYRRAVKDKLIHPSIVPVFDIDKKHSKLGVRRNMFTHEQRETLMKRLPEPLNLMLPFCLDAGVRKKEATFVHRKLVDLNERLITLKAQETKSQKQRVAPVSKKLLVSLVAWEEKTRREFPNAEYFFHLNGERLTEAELDEAFNNTCETLGWHTPKVDADGNILRTKGRKIKWNRSPRWHDSRRNATTASGVLPGVKDLDRQRMLGQSDPTLENYDQNESAKTIRDAIDQRDAMDIGTVPPVVAGLQEGREEVTIEDKLRRLKAMFESGLIDTDEYKSKRNQLLSAF